MKLTMPFNTLPIRLAYLTAIKQDWSFHSGIGTKTFNFNYWKTKTMKTKIDMSKEARTERYQEYLQLKSLPFWDIGQSARFAWLLIQRKKDNQYAFQHRIAEGNFVGVINEND